MEIRKALLLSWLLLMLLLLSLGGCSSKVSFEYPKAKEGTLDLTEWNEEEVINLDGQWEFYQNQLLEPLQLQELSLERVAYIEVPSSWNKYNVPNQEFSGDGFATYRLRFITDESKRLGMKIPRVFTAYKLWINNELVATAGIVGESRKTMTPQYLPQLALFDSQVGENEMVMQVSNYYHRSGGLLESLMIGQDQKIMELRFKKIAYELFLFGSLMIIGAYHLAMYLFRKKDSSPLYFGLFCILIGIRTLLVGERFFIYVFPDFNWEVAHKMQTLIYYLGVPLFLMFFKSVFPNAFHTKAVKIVQVIAAGFGCLVLFTPAKIFTVFNPIYQVFSLVIIGYIIFVFIKMLFLKKKGIGLIIAGAVALIITSINDIVFLSIWMNDNGSPLLRSIFRSGNLSSFGQLIFVFANSLVLAHRFSTVLEHEEVMSAKLKEINTHLDELVIQRTEDLEKSRQKVEEQKGELEKANEALRLISLKDPLTDLWNRRHYDNTIEIEWNRGLRQERPISLMVLDIDNFKAYNDYYGHSAGDECLIQVAQALKSCIKRAGELAARYGGEEFVVIMPDLEKEEAIKMAEMVRTTIEALAIPHQCSTVSKWVTVSIGVTSIIPDRSSSVSELFHTADMALYQVKASGRNQVKFLPW